MNKHLRNHLNEDLDSQAKYRGYNIFLSKLGNFFIVIYRMIFIRRSLQDAMDLIDRVEKDKQN